MATDIPAVLRMFHEARRTAQIIKRLELKTKECKQTLSDLGAAMCLFSIWKKGMMLACDKTLYTVLDVGFMNPEVHDLKPKYAYIIAAVRKDRQGELFYMPNETVTIYPERQQFFRVPTNTEIASIIKGLEVTDSRGKCRL